MTFIREKSFGGNSSYRYKIDENLNSDVDQSYNVIFNVYRLPRTLNLHTQIFILLSMLPLSCLIYIFHRFSGTDMFPTRM